MTELVEDPVWTGHKWPHTRPILVVHGFGYDPWGTVANSPQLSFVPQFSDRIFPGYHVIGHNYYSAPAGVCGVVNSWLAGRWNRYRHAWDLAEAEGLKLRKYIDAMGEQVDIVCHSLGARVVASAFSQDYEDLFEGKVRRVILLNGAEHVSRWAEVLRRPRLKQTQFLNICVKEDDVLAKLGSVLSPGRFHAPCVGQTGLGAAAPDRWIDVCLDDPETKAAARRLAGYDLRGDNPSSYGDHNYSFKWKGNWPLYRDWIAGRWRIEDPRKV